MSPVEPNHDRDWMVFQKPEALFDPVDVDTHRLLAQGRLSGLGRSLQVVDVGQGRRTDNHCIHLRIREHGFRLRGQGGPIPTSQLSQLRSARIGNRVQVGLRMRRNVGGVNPAYAAKTDQREIHQEPALMAFQWGLHVGTGSQWYLWASPSIACATCRRESSEPESPNGRRRRFVV